MDHPGLFYLEQDLRRSLRKAWYQTVRYLEQHPEEDAGQVWARVLERNVHAFAYQLPMNLYDWGITEEYSELSHAAEVSLRVSKTSAEDPIRKGKNYQVKKGDTLIGIARRYGITPEQLYEVNPGLKEQDPRKLAVGTVLALPYGAPFRMKAQIEVFVPLHQARILEAYYNLGLLRRLTGVKALDLQYYRDPRSPSPLAPRSSFGNHPPADDQPPDSWDKWNRRDTPSPSPYAPWERNSNHGKGPGPWIDGYGERNRLDDNPAYPHYLMSAYDLRRKGTVQVQPYRKPPLKLSPHVNEPNQAFQLAPLIPALEEVSGKVVGRSLLAGAGWILTLLCLSGDTRREPLEMLPLGEGWPGPISSSVYDQLSAEEAQRYNELRYKKAAGKASDQESRDFQELEEKLVEGNGSSTDAEKEDKFLIETPDEALSNNQEEDATGTVLKRSTVGEDWDILSTNVKFDQGANDLAEEIGGVAQVRFRNDIREFDAISDKYIGQHKPALGDNFGQSFKRQARSTFEAAKATGREVYYRFDEQPGQKVIEKLNQYSEDYGVPVTIKY